MKLTRPSFDELELEKLRECLASGWVTQGPFVREFERLIVGRHEVEHALATTSCTAALHLAVLALGVTSGDEVIVPAFTWITSAHCAEYAGAKVVFADVDSGTFNLDPEGLEAAITPRTRAIVAVHLFGLPAEMDAINDIAKRHGIFVIEDAACAIGTRYRGKAVGGLGDIGCFSFHPRKVITTGEGGMVTTNSSELAERVQYLRNHGATGFRDDRTLMENPWYMASFEELGFNLRLSDIQAAVGVAQMAKLDDLLAERRAIAKRYAPLLSGLSEVALPVAPGHCEHTFQSYVVRILEGGCTRRNHAMEYMAKLEIQTRPGTHAVHRLGYYANKYGLDPGQFPVACQSEETTIALPLFPGMSQAQQEAVAAGLSEGLG